MENKTKPQRYTFEGWCKRLDTVAINMGYQKELVTTTGSECWQNYYDDGYTPKSAFIADLRETF